MAFTEEEIRIIQERRAARAARAAREGREAAGLAEEPEPPKRRGFRLRLALGKILLIVLMGGLITLAASMFWNFGTLSPCDALAQALHGALMQEAVSAAMTSAETPSPEISARSRFPAVDLRIEPLSPAQCTEALVEFERSDERSFVDWFLAQPAP
jgi:hypothetical protein